MSGDTRHPDSARSIRQGFVLRNARLLLSLLLIVGGSAVLMYFNQQQHNLVQTLLLQNARQYIDALTVFRTLYTDEVVAVVRPQGIAITHDLDANPHAIPLPATLSMMLGNRLTARTGEGHARLYSPYPFPWREEEGGLRDNFDEAAWAFFQQNPDKPYYRFESDGDNNTLRYATADLMRSSCLGCHNTHPDTPRKGWELGDVRGILSVTLAMDSVQAQAKSSLQGTFIITAILGLFAVTALNVVIRALQSSAAETQKTNKLLASEIVVRKQAQLLSQKSSEELALRNIELQDANTELEEFNYVASHDLQEPLRTLESYTSLLKEDLGEAMSDDVAEDIHFVSQAAARMRDLVQDLLELSRTNSREMKQEAVDLNQCMEDIVLTLQVAIEQAQGTIVWNALPTVTGDSSQLMRVLQNLVSNGLKFRGEDDPRVEIRASKENDFWRVEVIDNGIGIEEKYYKQIFTAFKRLHGTSQYEGTGIGLAIVSKIIERHNGKIGIESAAGGGCTFWFNLPV